MICSDPIVKFFIRKYAKLSLLQNNKLNAYMCLLLHDGSCVSKCRDKEAQSPDYRKLINLCNRLSSPGAHNFIQDFADLDMVDSLERPILKLGEEVSSIMHSFSLARQRLAKEKADSEQSA